LDTPERLAAVSLPISCEGRWVKLRPLSRRDYPTFFQWRADVESLHLWSSERRVPTFEEYANELETLLATTITLLILTPRDEPIGFVQAYHLNHSQGWCRFLIYVSPEHRAAGYVLEAPMLFGDYLFSNFNFRKVYADVFEYNDDVLRMLTAGGFVEEGRLKQHIFFGGQFWDLINLALYRRGWEELKERLGFGIFADQQRLGGISINGDQELAVPEEWRRTR
jgi:RimJ/RimL family protein N-acetyltransferase